MNRVTLTLRRPPPFRVDVSSLSLPYLATLGTAQIAAIPLKLGGLTVDAGELFDVAVTPSDDSTLVVVDSCDRLDGLAAGTVDGKVEVFGDTGAWLARGMSGGQVEVHGSCGAYAGTGMTGGQLHICGSAGDFLAAAALPDRTYGLQGGTIIVDGGAGARAADRMRRGLLLIGGTAGRYCASRMIAGTVSVLGTVDEGVGFSMRRGTILLSVLPRSLSATFNQTGAHEPTFLHLLRKYLSQAGYAAHARSGCRVQRWVGDRAVGGLGEILLCR